MSRFERIDDDRRRTVFSVILPAYQEERTIERAIREVSAVFSEIGKPFEILVVDDGSTDATSEAVDRIIDVPGLRLLRHEANQGKGSAVRTGVREAVGDVLLFLDCDLATHPSHMKAFLPHLENADVLIGSRRVAGARIDVQQPQYRVRLGQLFNVMMRAASGLPFRDTQCGFKVFTRRAADVAFRDLETKGWAFDVEALIRVQNAGLIVIELPVEWRNGRESRVRLRDAGSILRDLWRLRRISRREPFDTMDA